MKMNLKYWVLAAAMTIGLGGVALQADDAKDYSKTKQYQQGVRGMASAVALSAVGPPSSVPQI